MLSLNVCLFDVFHSLPVLREFSTHLSKAYSEFLIGHNLGAALIRDGMATRVINITDVRFLTAFLRDPCDICKLKLAGGKRMFFSAYYDQSC